MRSQVLDLRLLQYFLAVADVEHVGRAAEQLHISQSPLSRQVRALEQQLGLELFRRERRRIRLTEAGRWLQAEARVLLDQAARLEVDSQRLARGEIGRISVGFVRSAMWSRVLPAALRRFGREHPEVRLELRNLGSDAQLAALRRGELDLALVHAGPRLPELLVEPLLEEPYLLALPEGHALATRRRLAPAQLDGAPWVALSRTLHPALHDRFLAACGRAGFVPDVRSEAADHATMLALVESGLGLALVPASARPSARLPGVVFREAAWFPARLRVELVRRKSDTSPGADALATALRTSAGRGAVR
jgi:DNA-binding transcriptional LysR family regulator